MYKIFIDGQAGTTGLKINQYLDGRADLELLSIADEERKNDDAKLALIEEADVVILCLPDEAAIQTVELGRNTGARMLDASTAHRVSPDWAYGLPELCPGQRDQIANARHVSNPGCYPTGFLLAVAPLIRGGVLRSDVPLTISAISGYTGGGRQMVEQYEARSQSNPDSLWYVCPYSLGKAHKHLPEMKQYAGLSHTPMFLPYVAHYPQGMLVSIPLATEWLTKGSDAASVAGLLADCYMDEACVRVHGVNDNSVLEDGKLEPQANNETNRVDLFVFGFDDQLQLIARLDNLGKGAAGAAVQNLNVMLGLDELHGLCVKER